MRESTRGFSFGGAMEKLTQDYLMQCLTYEPDTGNFRWKLPTSKRRIYGAIAGSIDKHPDSGYVIIRINNKGYRAHRLAWLYFYGEVPKNQIDHINGIKTDNRIFNLRKATHGQNCMNRTVQKNNKSGYKGVCYMKKHNKWRARIGFNGMKIDIGLFNSAEEAALAYVNKAIELHGEFFRF